VHKTFFKEVRVKDPEYLIFLRGKPCFFEGHPLHICSGDTYGHHSLLCPHKAMGQKGGDNHAFTVCHALHVELHLNGNERSFLLMYGFTGNILEKTEKDYEDYLNEKS